MRGAVSEIKMIDIFNNQPIITLFNLTWRYLFVAGFYYMFFYIWRNKSYWYHKIQERYPKKSDIKREIIYSSATVLIFGCVVMLVVLSAKHGLTRSYQHIADKGYGYYFFSILLMILMHDTYFYWSHRLMHWKPLFKIAHKIHHLSTNPTPFAAYAFHPLEALVEISILPLIAFTIPYHKSALILFSIYALLLNVSGHLGFELFPKGFASHRLFKWHNTSTHHNMHHRLVKCNYGLYFNIWDRLMGTNHPDYEKSFEAVTERRDEAKIKAETLQKAL
ncbi:sterol desaturase family protein [soil metagenome]|jgi:lathosterol oxidase